MGPGFSMKKILFSLFLLLLTLILMVSYRTAFYFKDKQVSVTQQPIEYVPDINAAAQRLSQAIQFNTLSTDDVSRQYSAEFTGLITHLKNSYPNLWRTFPPRFISNHSLLFHFKSSSPASNPIMFLAHTDVVPVDEETSAQWHFPPFSGAIVDGNIWGRGTIDNKSSVLALLEVLEYMLLNDIVPPRDIYLAFGHDEEIGGTEGAAKIAAHLAQQGTSFEFILDEGGVITEDIMPGIDQPLALIGVAEKGFVNFKLTTEGTGGHSSQPPTHTAAGVIAQAVVDIENSPFPADLSFMEMTFDKIGYHATLDMKLPFSNLWMLQPVVESAMLANRATAASIRTTAAVTMLKGSSKSNILPTEASAVVNYRIFPGTTIAEIQKNLANVIANEQINITPFMGTEPSAVSPADNQNFRLLERTIRRFDENILVAPYLVIAGTDAKHYHGLSDSIYRFAMVRFTPQSLSRIHGINEHISFEDYHRLMQFYYLLMTTETTD